MIRVLFVCHGNICRSPMAEFILRDMVRAKGIANDFHIESAATSTEEIGNPVHHGTRRKLLEHGISKEEISFKQARQMRKEDYAKFDYIIGMDEMNLRNIMRILRSDPETKSIFSWITQIAPEPSPIPGTPATLRPPTAMYVKAAKAS